MPDRHIAFIGMDNGEVSFLDPDQVMGTSNIVYYLPSPDAITPLRWKEHTALAWQNCAFGVHCAGQVIP